MFEWVTTMTQNLLTYFLSCTLAYHKKLKFVKIMAEEHKH